LIYLALALFVAGVVANNAQIPPTFDEFAVFAAFFKTGFDFHDFLPPGGLVGLKGRRFPDRLAISYGLSWLFGPENDSASVGVVE